MEKSKYNIGQKVHWNDPTIEDFSPEERKEQAERVYTIYGVYGNRYLLEDEYGEAEALENEITAI